MAQQIPNFTSKLITHTITILNIHKYNQKKRNKIKEEKMVGMIIPGYVLGAPKLSLTKMGYIRLEEHQPLLASKLKSLDSNAIKARKSLS